MPYLCSIGHRLQQSHPSTPCRRTCGTVKGCHRLLLSRPLSLDSFRALCLHSVGAIQGCDHTRHMQVLRAGSCADGGRTVGVVNNGREYVVRKITLRGERRAGRARHGALLNTRLAPNTPNMAEHHSASDGGSKHKASANAGSSMLGNSRASATSGGGGGGGKGGLSGGLTQPAGWQSLLSFTILFLAWLAGFSSRLFAVIRFESIIHEFDPW